MERNNLGTMKFKLLLGALFLSLSLSAQVKPGIEVLRDLNGMERVVLGRRI